MLAQKVAPDGSPTQSAHPARFSPDDKFSRERVECKRRFGLLPTQQPRWSFELCWRAPCRGEIGSDLTAEALTARAV